MSYLFTLLLSLLGLSAAPTNAKTVDDQTFISQQNNAVGSDGTDADADVHIAQDQFAAFFHS